MALWFSSTLDVTGMNEVSMKAEQRFTCWYRAGSYTFSFPKQRHLSLACGQTHSILTHDDAKDDATPCSQFSPSPTWSSTGLSPHFRPPPQTSSSAEQSRAYRHSNSQTHWGVTGTFVSSVLALSRFMVVYLLFCFDTPSLPNHKTFIKNWKLHPPGKWLWNSWVWPGLPRKNCLDS